LNFDTINDLSVSVEGCAQKIANKVQAITKRVLTENEKAFIVSHIRSCAKKKAIKTVTLPEFQKFWKWYKITEKKLILDSRVKPLFDIGFIHGFMGRDECEELLLSNKKVGCAILRFSTTKTGWYSISYTTEESLKDGKVVHDLIKVAEDAFQTPDGHSSTLIDVLRSDKVFRNIKYIYPDLSVENNTGFLLAFQECGKAVKEPVDTTNYNRIPDLKINKG